MLKQILSLALLVVAVHGHGRLTDPPGRSTIWREPAFEHLGLPLNYNDNELFCGGYAVQYNQNGGRCGLCGDSYSDPIPRNNENGGMYGRGVISRTYHAGSVIESTVQITSNHWGHFEFAVCPLSGKGFENPDGCRTLQLANGAGEKYEIGSDEGYYHVHLKLPDGFTCRHCTFQWTYHTANSWGWCDEDKTHGDLGCGDQEMFRGCADIAIL